MAHKWEALSGTRTPKEEAEEAKKLDPTYSDSLSRSERFPSDAA
jgi:hypothetical protein